MTHEELDNMIMYYCIMLAVALIFYLWLNPLR